MKHINQALDEALQHLKPMNTAHAKKTPQHVEILHGDYAGQSAPVIREDNLTDLCSGRSVPVYVVEVAPGVRAMVRQSYTASRQGAGRPRAV